MTLPPLEPRKYFVKDRIQKLLENFEWCKAVLFAYENDAFGPSDYGDYLKAKAAEQAEREWAERMDVLLDADINNLELYR